MIPVFVIFTACTSLGECQRQEVPFDGSRIECNAHSELVVVRWLAEHQGRELQGGFACRVGRAA
jgi:hypothetical protein